MKRFLKNRNKVIRIATIIIVMVCLIIGFCIWQNNSIVVSNYSYFNKKINKAFDGFKILQISDFHNKQFGKGQANIVSKVEAAKPNLIVITGDLIDRRRYNLEIAMELINKIVKLAPVCYVPGNHEAWSGKYDEVKSKLIEAGVTILDNETHVIIENQQELKLIGLKDPAFMTNSYMDGTNTSEMEKYLNNVDKDSSFKILLSHRPEVLDIYDEYDMDLVFSGHAHGGQFRLPFIGGIFAPEQGFLPKYDGGRYENGDTTMFLSRGLGNSLIPLRLFNRPELVMVTLKSK